MSKRGSIILGLAMGVLIVTTIVIGLQFYYSPNTTHPSEASYNIDAYGDGFLISANASKKIEGPVKIKITKFGSDSETKTTDIPNTGDPVFIDPLSKISDIQAIIIEYKGEEIHRKFISNNLASQLHMKDVGVINVKPQEQLTLSLDDFVNDTTIVESYIWDTGTKIIENKTFTEVYNEDGTYISSLIIEDNQGRRYRTDFNVVVGAGFTENKTLKSPLNDISMNFTTGENIHLTTHGIENKSNRRVEKYTWDFDNGIISDGKSVVHQYNEKGSYNISLTVQYTSGAQEVHNHRVFVNNNSNEGILVRESRGYKFTYEARVDDNVKDYVWKLGDGTIIESKTVFEHTYDKYGKYNVTLMVEKQNGEYQNFTTTVTTEVLVEMSGMPYSVEFVSGNHAEKLLPQNKLGDSNPSIQFRENIRYRITNLPEKITFKSDTGEVLLSQSKEGIYENDTDVNWKEISAETVVFTVTEELGEDLYTYKTAD
jgi:PKD repeat protein